MPEPADGPARPEMQDPNTAQLRRSASIRVAVSVLLAGAITAAAIVFLWGPLSVKTDLVGYPIFADFNGYNYFKAFYLVVGFFPIAALLLFLGLTRLGPRIGLAAPPLRGRLHPPSTPLPQAGPTHDGDPPLTVAPAAKQRAVTIARIAFIGGVLGLEAGIAANHVWRGLVLGVAIYALGAILSAAALDRWGPGGWSLEGWLTAINAIATPLTVLGLFAVSSNTEVRVLADGSVHHYPWFPIWLALPAAAVLIAWIAARVRRSGSAPKAIEIERRALVLIAAPVCLFLLLALLLGNAGSFETFEAGQRLVADRLVGDGWLPWRDVVLAHGLLADVVHPAISFAVFGNSYWGDGAGDNLLLGPLYLVSTYFLFVYLFGRNWLFLLFCGLVVLDGTVAPPDFRFILWPLILLVLAGVLDHPTPLRAVALAFLAVGQAIVTAESAPALLAVAVVLVLYEWYWREPGTRLVAAFRRTLWFAGAGFVFATAFAAYLASRGALDDFVYISINLVRGHTLDGALPPGPNPGTISDALFYFLALAPPAALLISFAYAVARLRLRRVFLTEDWVMAAIALFLLVYYAKFLSRMDNHVYQPFVEAFPLLLFILYRTVTAIERAIRDRWPRRLAVRLTAHPVCLALVVVVGLTSANWRDRIGDAGARYAPTVAQEPRLDRLGYVEPFNATDYRDLRRVIDAYLGPNDRLFDLTGEPGLFFYLFDRDPSTRYFLTNSVTDSAELQGDVIDRLRQARPKLVTFDNTDPSFIGLANYDGTASMVRQYLVSQWILDHYRPLLAIHGHTIYARRDMPPASKVNLHLSQKPVTRGVAFLSQPCNWGYAPTFLSGPGMPGPGARSVGAQARPAPNLVTIVGWAGDPAAKLPAREVIATLDGRIVGRAKPELERPDVVAYGLPRGFLRTGFQMQVPDVPDAKLGRLRVFGVARDGHLTEIVPQGGHPAHGTIEVGGRTVHIDPKAVYGQINRTTQAHGLQIGLPAGSRWTDYRWLEVDAGPGGFREGQFGIYDRQTRPSPYREIYFQTLDRSPRRYTVPVGSCPQWHGYRGRRLFLSFHPRQDISAVRLIR